MKTMLQTSMRAAVLTAVLAIVCEGCFLLHQQSAYRLIHEYAEDGDVTRVAEELTKNPGNLDLPDDAGLTPLHLAAAHCRNNVVALLLDKGADINRKANDDATPLHLAAQEGCTDVVMMLLSNRANVNARDDQGRTPLVRAEQWHRGDIVQLILKYGGSK